MGKQKLDLRVLQAKQFIDNNYSSIRRMQTVALAVGISHELLRKEFPRTFRLSMQDYLHRVRIEQAKLLVRSKCKLYSVAIDVGYSTEALLIRHWKKIFGTTPGQYKAGLKQEKEIALHFPDSTLRYRKLWWHFRRKKP